MEKKNKNGVIVAWLLLIIVLLIICIMFLVVGMADLRNSKNNISNEQKEVSNVTSVVGMYEAKFENITLGEEVETEDNYYKGFLTLYENGIFEYKYMYHIPSGIIGNYVVNGNKINLYYWGNTGSGTGVAITGGEKTLSINDDGSILDNDIKNKVLKDNNVKSVILVKSNDSVGKKDITHIINESFFVDKVETLEDPYA